MGQVFQCQVSGGRLITFLTPDTDRNFISATPGTLPPGGVIMITITMPHEEPDQPQSKKRPNPSWWKRLLNSLFPKKENNE
jgi:hypothetical protein